VGTAAAAAQTHDALPDTSLPSTRRRHTDTKGVLAFLNDSADATEETPLRPPHQEGQQQQQQSELVLTPCSATPYAVELCLSTTLKPTTATAVGAAGLGDQSSSAEDAPTHSPSHSSDTDVTSPVEETSAHAVDGGHVWSSLKKTRRAMSLSSTSLISPTRALADDDDIDNNSGVVGAEDGVGGMGDDSEDDDDGPVTACGTAADKPPAPLPVTPERPAQMRYFRCAKPLLQIGSDNGNAATIDSAVAVEEQKKELDSEEDGKTDVVRDIVTAHVGGDTLHEDSVAMASSLTSRHSGEGEGEEEEVVERAPRVLDMNTTVLDDDADSEKDAAMKADESRAEGSYLHVDNVDAIHRNSTPAVVVAAAAAPQTRTEEEQRQIPTETVHVTCEEQVSLSEPVSTCLAGHGDVGVDDIHLLCTEGVHYEAEVGGFEVQSHMTASATSPAVSANASFADSREGSDDVSDVSSDTTSSSGVSLHRVATAAPASMGLPSCRSSSGHTRDVHGDRSSGDNEHHGNHSSLSSLTASNSSGEENKKEEMTLQATSPSPVRVEGESTSAKWVSLSSGRGQSSSYGCTEGMNSPASHQTRTSTPQREEEEAGSDDVTAGMYRRSTSPVVVVAAAVVATTATSLSHTPPRTTNVVSNNDDSSELVVVPLKHVHVRSRKLNKATDDEAWLEGRSTAAEYHAEFVHTRRDVQHIVWQSALASLEALVEEYQVSLLATAMKEFREAWLPATPPTGLHHVNAAALLPPPYVARPKTKMRALYASAASAACSTNGLVETVVDGHCARESELSLLFRLFTNAPSRRGKARLVQMYFIRHLQRYVNWVNHLHFEFLYVRLVAVRAMQMLEMHERRLTCMRRDLGIRDRIELFTLLAPRPRAPTLSTGRGVFSAFRMALHSLGGGDRQQRSRTSSSSAKNKDNSSRGKPTHATSSHPPPTRTTPAAHSGRPPVQATKKDSAVALEAEVPTASSVEPLFASERCRSGKYAVPVVCELAARPIGAPGQVGVLPCSSSSGGGCSSSGRAAEKRDDEGTEEAAAPVVREVLKDADPPLESSNRHRGTPRPLNKTYSNYYKLVAEKKSNPPSLLTDIHLPQLRRTASRTSSTSRRASADKGDSARERKEGAEGCGEKISKLGRLFLSSQPRKPSRSPRRQKDKTRKDGGIRAKERVASKPRNRTPPPPPTEADFVDLRDETALRRFMM
jgi:hypothetical protein